MLRTQPTAEPARDVTDLAGKRIIITGGTTGIGCATARLLAAGGAQLFIFGREQDDLRDVLARLALRLGL